MKEIIDYISNNAFISTIISVFVGGIISSMTTIYVSSQERKDRRKEEMIREKNRQFENKAELKIENSWWEKKKNDIELFLLEYKLKPTNENEKQKSTYSNKVKNIEYHKYKDFYLKNIGNADINELYICVTHKGNNALIDYNYADMVVDNELVEFSYCYDRKILRNETIKLRLYFLEDDKINNLISCSLAIMYKDSFGNLYEQPFWHEKNNLYPPHPITYEEYKQEIKYYL